MSPVEVANDAPDAEAPRLCGESRRRKVPGSKGMERAPKDQPANIGSARAGTGRRKPLELGGIAPLARARAVERAQVGAAERAHRRALCRQRIEREQIAGRRESHDAAAAIKCLPVAGGAVE